MTGQAAVAVILADGTRRITGLPAVLLVLAVLGLIVLKFVVLRRKR